MSVAEEKRSEPIRGDLFSTDEMAGDAKKLASTQQIAPGKPDTELLKQFQRNARFLQLAYGEISKAIL